MPNRWDSNTKRSTDRKEKKSKKAPQKKNPNRYLLAYSDVHGNPLPEYNICSEEDFEKSLEEMKPINNCVLVYKLVKIAKPVNELQIEEVK